MDHCHKTQNISFSRLRAGIALVFGFLLLSASADGANIAIITRDDILPYREFTERYQEAGKKSGHIIKVFSLESETASGRTVRDQITAYAPGVLVCVGKSASVFAAEQFPERIRICSMIPSPRDVADIVKSGACVVSMDIRAEKKLEILRTIKPRATTIGTVYDPGESGELVRELEAAAAREGISLRALSVAAAKDAPSAVKAMVASSIDAFILLYDRTLLTPQTLETLFAESFFHRVPVIGFSEKYVTMGALLSLEAPIPDLARAAWQATERYMSEPAACTGIIKIATAGRIIVNRTIAEKLGITIPATLKNVAAEIK